MKILVTGGAGFIGSNFIRYWMEKNPKDQIINFDKLTYAGNLEATLDFQHNENYRFVFGDICDENLVDKVMKDVDIVIHFAAESHVDRSIENPDVFLKTNVLGTHTLLNAALKHKVKRFHHISTDEVFGHLELNTKDKFNEDTNYSPRSAYSASKASSDMLVRSYFHTYGLPITITNCSNNFGAFQSPEKFIPRSITNLLEGNPIKLYGDGKYVRDWLHVDDHCEAIELVVKKGKVGETYCVGGQVNEEISNKDIAEMLLDILNKPTTMVEYVNDRPGHDRKYAVSWKKINKELGWEPRKDFKEWLEETVDWYVKNEPYWKQLKIKAEEFYAKINR